MLIAYLAYEMIMGYFREDGLAILVSHIMRKCLSHNIVLVEESLICKYGKGFRLLSHYSGIG